MEITYVTGNSYKIELDQRILGPVGVKLIKKNLLPRVTR